MYKFQLTTIYENRDSTGNTQERKHIFTMVPNVVPLGRLKEKNMGSDEKCQKLFDKMCKAQANIPFSDLCTLAELVGFTFARQKGSHKVYKHKKHPEFMNFQSVKGKAKSYQIKQLIAFINEHDLLPKEDI